MDFIDLYPYDEYILTVWFKLKVRNGHEILIYPAQIVCIEEIMYSINIHIERIVINERPSMTLLIFLWCERKNKTV